MALQWEAFTAQPEAQVARWLARENETDMVELFIDCLSAVDSPSEDVPLLLGTPFVSGPSYGGHLLDELAQLLQCWNQTPRGDERPRAAMNASPGHPLTGPRPRQAPLGLVRRPTLSSSSMPWPTFFSPPRAAFW
jgi:hypothetical protein